MKILKFAVAAIVATFCLTLASCSPTPVLSAEDKKYIEILDKTVPDLSGDNEEKIAAGKKFCELIESYDSVDQAFVQFGNAIFDGAADKNQASRALFAMSSSAVLIYCPTRWTEFQTFTETK